MRGRPGLLAVDVDGTMTYEEPYLHLGALKSLRSLGTEIPITIVTGNPYPIAYAISAYARLSRELLGVAENGGVIYFGEDHRVLAKEWAREEILKFLSELGYAHLISEDSDFRYVDIALRVDRRLGEKIVSELKVKGYEVEGVHSGYALHLMPPGIDKGAGLKALCEELGIEEDRVVAIGDSDNDLSMFEVAGFSIALPNAPERVKEAADLVVGGPGYGYSLPLALRVVREML